MPFIQYNEEGGADVSLGESPENRGFSDPPESVNLVPSILKDKSKKYSSIFSDQNKLDGKAVLKEIGQVVVDEFKIDLTSRSVWEENTSKILKLFTAFAEVKNTPWQNASNVILPILNISTIQFQSRAYDALIPPKEVVKVLSTGDENIERAERVSKYMNYQLLYKMEDFEEGMDKSLMQLPLEGSIFKKTYYDSTVGRNVSEYISAFDFVMNYGVKNLESAQRKTHILYMTQNDIRLRTRSGIFAEGGWDLGSGTVTNTSDIKTMADRLEGVERPSGDEYNQPRMILEQHRLWDLDGDGITEPYVMTVDLETDKVLRITSRTYQDSQGKEQVIEYFTQYTFLPNPEGVYGLGFGTLLRGLNEAANTIVNEVIDAGSLANLQGGFFLRKSGVKASSLKFKQGEFKAIDAYVDDIRKALFHMDFKGPNQTLYAVLGLLYEYSKLVSSVSETMTGQLPASDTPATTVLALIEEGRKVFSSIHKRIYRAFGKESRKIYRLNSQFLDEREYFQALGDKNVPEGARIGIGKADFEGNLDVIPVCDPAITSKAEKVMKAQAVVQDVRGNPMTASNQQANFEATKRYYKALEVENIDQLLQSPEPPDLSPEEENAGFLTEKPATVLPKQDHVHHLQVLSEFQEGSFAESLTPTGKKLAEQHSQEHIAELYLQEEQEKAETNARLDQGIPSGGLG